MADSQVPWGVDALGGTISEPAWGTKPSWYLVTTEDRMIPPPAQRTMSQRAGSTVVEASGSHAIYVSQPSAVAALIKHRPRWPGGSRRGPGTAGRPEPPHFCKAVLAELAENEKSRRSDNATAQRHYYQTHHVPRRQAL